MAAALGRAAAAALGRAAARGPAVTTRGVATPRAIGGRGRAGDAGPGPGPVAEGVAGGGGGGGGLGRAQRLAPPLGFAAGLFGSLVGIGGGALITPVLVRATEVPPRVISGTSLCAVLATSTAAGWAYSDAGQVDLQAAAVLGAAAMLTAGAGARFVHKVAPETTRRALGAFLCFVAPLIPAKAWALRHVKREGEEPGGAVGSAERTDKGGGGTPSSAADFAVLVATGLAAGFASGAFGVGGGTVVTPLLALTTDMAQVSVVGTSLTAMFVPSLVALASHARLGNVRLGLGLPLAAATLCGAALGSRLGLAAPPGYLEAAFGGGMLYLGVMTLLK